MINIRKVFLILFSCLLLMSIIQPVYAQFDAQKQIILTRIDNTINRLNNLETAMGKNPALSDVTKNIIINSLDEVEKGLLEYKNKVNNTTSLAELRKVNQEVIKFLVDNKDIIKENMKKAIIDMAQQASKKAEELMAKAEQVLTLLKLTCPSEKETIEKLEMQLEQLETEINVLNQAIQSEDITTLKQEIPKLTQLSFEIADNVNTIKAKCRS